MQFIRNDLQAATARGRAATDLKIKAKVHNIDFDERVGADRLNELEGSIPALAPSGAALLDALIDDVKTRFEVTDDRIPATFGASNSTASLPDLPPQRLVRLETLDWILPLWGGSFDALSKAHLGGSGPEKALVEKFCDLWNDERDNRPCFAAFKDQLLPDLAEADWANRLRDRLGLPYGPLPTGPHPVALMEYDTLDVIAQSKGMPGAAYRFCIPSTFDHRPAEQFFPTPRECGFGCPMSLGLIQDEKDLLAEIVHLRLTYSPRHLVKLGQITAPLPGTDFRTMRNNHLMALQLESGRYDFGAEL
jgi:hypothetical protein